MKRLVLCVLVFLLPATSAFAFLEDLCLPRRGQKNATLSWCVQPSCPVNQRFPNRACLVQLADFGTIQPGRSMVHMDSTYFIAQALGYRADVAYWIAAYNEVTDYTQYVPIDQCGVQAANANTLANGMTKQTAPNSGANFITARFNGFQRTNLNTDGPLDHYIVNYSPNGTGTDVHGAGGVSALYPFHYPVPGYPQRIEDTYEKTLANLRQWGMFAGDEPGLLCVVGLTTTDTSGATTCLTGATIAGNVPVTMANVSGIPLKNIPTGKKVLNYTSNGNNPPAISYYEELGAYLKDSSKTTGTLWLDPNPGPVPVQLARIGLYLHTLQDSDSHATYCGDDSPSPPGGGDPGTWMTLSGNQVKVSFGDSCAAGPHLAGHVQETGTGAASLPLRDYVALNYTVDELILFGNSVAKQRGWIVNPELLPPDAAGGKNGQGKSAADLQAELVGTTPGPTFSGTEVYTSGIVTLPLQQANSLDRLHAMNSALGQYSATLAARSADPSKFKPLQPMPGNSFDPNDKSRCWQPTP